jgi:probable phosphoglycerate mutase
MLNPTAFWFLRHGETDWNAQGLSQGRTDVPLNATGIAQAHRAAGLLQRRGIGRVVSSTLARAMDTARVAAAALDLPFDTDPDLQEACFGAEEGRAMGAWYDDWVAGTYLPAGAEKFADLRTRVRTVVNRITAAPGLALIVAHGSLFRAARAEMGLSAHFRTPNGVPLLCQPGTPSWTLVPASPDDKAVMD